MALKLSGMAAKNFALFVYAVLKDQKKKPRQDKACADAQGTAPVQIL